MFYRRFSRNVLLGVASLVLFAELSFDATLARAQYKPVTLINVAGSLRIGESRSFSMTLSGIGEASGRTSWDPGVEIWLKGPKDDRFRRWQSGIGAMNYYWRAPNVRGTYYIRVVFNPKNTTCRSAGAPAPTGKFTVFFQQ